GRPYAGALPEHLEVARVRYAPERQDGDRLAAAALGPAEAVAPAEVLGPRAARDRVGARDHLICGRRTRRQQVTAGAARESDPLGPPAGQWRDELEASRPPGELQRQEVMSARDD